MKITRIGLGCMRLGEGGEAVIAAALEAGVSIFDTAHSYGPSADAAGWNEAMLGRALRVAGRDARVVTKGGMRRAGTAWIPDGRGRAIRADCEASLDALGGVTIDTFLLHAPDPRTSWATSVRALGRLVDDGLVPGVGVSNVNRTQLDQALAITDIAMVEVALSPFDDRAIRGGVVALCETRGITVLAHSPLGGPRRRGRLARMSELVEIARGLKATPEEVAVAWLLTLSPVVVPIPGARSPEAARSIARAAALTLDVATRAALDKLFGFAQRGEERANLLPPHAGGGWGESAHPEVVMVMGIPGAGKSRAAGQYVARGYTRLNRDERGGSLKEIAAALDESLADGARVVVDNTYLTRAQRSHVLETAARHGAAVRCVWLNTSLAQAQVNLVERLLDRFGHLPEPDELAQASRKEPWLMRPTSQMRTLRELEPPGEDEGFASIDRRTFVRERASGIPAVLVAAGALAATDWRERIGKAAPGAPHLLFDWRPGAAPSALERSGAKLAATIDGPVDVALCPHPGGPPICWCRPPLPGLPMAFARKHVIALDRSILIGTSPAHLTMAATLRMRAG